MNSVNLIGRLTKDPEIRYTAQSQMAVATFTLAIDRMTRQGEEKKADFPRIMVFGRSAENCEKFLSKGKLCGVTGRIQTGSYKDRDGKTVYTTDIVADRVEFLEWSNSSKSEQTSARNENRRSQGHMSNEPQQEFYEGFQAIPEDVPF